MTPDLARQCLRHLRRAWAGACYCRARLAEITASAPTTAGITDLRGQPNHDVDYWAWEAARIIKIA